MSKIIANKKSEIIIKFTKNMNFPKSWGKKRLLSEDEPIILKYKLCSEKESGGKDIPYLIT